MKKQLLHTPEGVRDIYGSEYERKLALQDLLYDQLKLYGYQDIQTPTFEFFDIFSSKIGTVPSNELYKFFDKEGNTLVLRPDFTPSIARATAKYFMDETMPIRFCYVGNNYCNTNDLQGRLKETTQIGAELISDGTVEADAEIISLVISSLKRTGLKDFQISVGNVEFFKGLCAEYGIDDEMELTLRDFISSKNYFGMEDILDEMNIDESVKQTFLKISELFGGIESMAQAKTLVSNQRSIKAVERLEELYHILTLYGLEKYVSFDLGMLSKYHYYTGIVFRAYTYGNGDAIAKGGRYDSLLNEFGKKAPAIGFGMVIDHLAFALSRQNIEIETERKKSTLVIYDKEQIKSAIQCADLLRAKGYSATMLLREQLSDEKTYTDSQNINFIYTIKSADKVYVNSVDEKTGSEVAICDI
ncbi:MAG: ATP phosphoribosyltransferase regulatory subunit [Clostridia bacterium]|nr:ATP phosphoribosyltransferase regulatory subunit [Clostridia bacterium]